MDDGSQLVSMFSDKEREKIAAEVRANLARLANLQPGCRIPDDPEPQRLDESARREWQLPEPEPPKPEPQLDTDHSRAWNAWCDERIAAAIAVEREFLLMVVGEGIGELLEQQRKSMS